MSKPSPAKKANLSNSNSDTFPSKKLGLVPGMGLGLGLNHADKGGGGPETGPGATNGIEMESEDEMDDDEPFPQLKNCQVTTQ